MTAFVELRQVVTSDACPDLCSHSLDVQTVHLMACVPCWTRMAKLFVLITDQIEERRYYAAAGLPLVTRERMSL